MFGRSNSSEPRIIIRPMTLVSRPEPEMFLPIASTTATSRVSNGMPAISVLARSRTLVSPDCAMSSGSRSTISAARS